MDGYDASGERIYDKVNGQTCHQCRQKTLGKRTACSCCQSLRVRFLGLCRGSVSCPCAVGVSLACSCGRGAAGSPSVAWMLGCASLQRGA